MFPLSKKQTWARIPLNVRTQIEILNRELNALIQLTVAMRHRDHALWVEFRRLVGQLPQGNAERVMQIAQQLDLEGIGWMINNLQDNINILTGGAELTLNEIRGL